MKAGLAPCVGLLLAAWGCASPPHRPGDGLQVGDEAPPFWTSGRQGGLSVGWLVRPEHLVSCETAARQLRHVRARYGASVPVSVATTEAQASAVHAFLRRERLSDLPVVALAEPEFRRRFGSVAEPALFVVRESRVVGRLAADRQHLREERGIDALARTLDSLHTAATVPEAAFRP